MDCWGDDWSMILPICKVYKHHPYPAQQIISIVVVVKLLSRGNHQKYKLDFRPTQWEGNHASLCKHNQVHMPEVVIESREKPTSVTSLDLHNFFLTNISLTTHQGSFFCRKWTLLQSFRTGQMHRISDYKVPVLTDISIHKGQEIS